ncbi:MAG: hypothetical protein K8M05_16480, partial [Deltaproteobacteria bacterium]|nr:hypothetical protein [Kofleriaceae bacterium]
RGEPAGLGAAPANGGDAPALQLKQNELRSILYTDLNPTTGLEKQQDKWVDAFVSDVEEALATWRKQRGTPDLAFKQDQEIKINTALKTFRRAAAKDPAFDLLMEAARSRLASGKNAAYVREIRMFNPWSLTELKYLMNVEDAEPSHKYEMRPVGGTTIEANVGVGKGGKVYKSIEVRYTNTLIPGLTWTQTVELDGWMLGAGVSLDAVLKKMGKGKKPKKPKPDSKDDHDANGGVQFSGSGGFEEAKEMPRDNYLAPGFFKGAQFTSPSVSGSASFTALDGKGGAGALLIRKGAESLLWESELSFTAEAGFDLAQLGDMLFEDSLGGLGDSGFDAGVDGTVEFGKTSLDGPLDFQAGEWGELEEVQPVLTEAWIPLHYARLYFDHGKDEPDAADVETIRSLSRMIHEFHDDTRRNPSKLFKVEVLGCHSQVFAEYDHELKILEARQERRGTLSDRDQQRLYELRLQKEMENYALAMRRATNSYGELLNALYALDRSDPAWRNVLEWSEIGPPRTRDPENQNPYSSSSQDRSATIVVSYQVNNTISGAFAGARRRRVAEDQGE